MGTGEKLKISCGNVDCENGLHCYRLSKIEAKRAIRLAAQLDLKAGALNDTAGWSTASDVVAPGAEMGQRPATPPMAGPIRYCKACGIEVVDWSRVHKREIRDAEHTFAAMRTEWIRHHYLHCAIDQLALQYVHKKGRTALRKRIASTIRSSIGRAASELWRDGAQTPFGTKPHRENMLRFARHATASCCRKCAEEWHNIPRNRRLTDDEIDYLTALAMRYVDERLPNLPNEPGSASKKGAGVRGRESAQDTNAAISPDLRADAAPPNTNSETHTRTTAPSRSPRVRLRSKAWKVGS